MSRAFAARCNPAPPACCIAAAPPLPALLHCFLAPPSLPSLLIPAETGRKLRHQEGPAPQPAVPNTHTRTPLAALRVLLAAQRALGRASRPAAAPS
jgi:hypothetical protein